MTELVFLQLVLPVALIGWLGLRPAPNRLGLAMQLVAALCLVLALNLSGLWLMPPWWMIWVYWLLLVIAALRAVLAWPVQKWPRGPGQWIALATFSVLAALAGMTAAQAWQGRQVPEGPKVALQFPLQGGEYLVANGGTNISVSSHAITFARATERQRRYYGQSHAVDIVALTPLGLTADGVSPSDPGSHAIFGRAVLAPCDGQVVGFATDRPDMQVPIMDKQNMVGNHVLLRCASADILLAHFRRGSVRVRPGQRVRVTEVLGEAGNSGNSSAPHLHIHAQEPGPPDAPFSGKPLPMTIGGDYLVRGDRIEVKP